MQRSHRAIASTVASVLEELHFDTELLRRHLAETTPALSARPWVDVIVDFRQRQSRYWSRCADVAWEIKDRGEPDQLERYLNVLELGTFHLHARVSQPANTALRAMGHLFLFWAELAMRVAADLQARPECASSRARVGERQSGVAFHRLLKALQTFDELPFVAFAEQLYYRDAPQTARYDMDQVLYLWGKLNEELPGLLPTDTTVEGLRWRCLVS
ncbi:MAG: hypothetical protein KGJ86_07670 [Chloroflexota bacterium]|nr:hypothetical protein [Chloroflexota bacterium]